MKKIFVITVTLFLLTPLFAQTNFDFGKKQAEIWKLAKQRTLAVAAVMPSGSYNFKPTDEVKSFGQQMTHIANSMLSMNARFIQKNQYSGREKNASSMTKDEIIADLSGAFDVVISQLESMKDGEMLAVGKPHGAFALTKWESFLFMYDHITNHRAKAVLYLRLNKVSPPPYGYN